MAEDARWYVIHTYSGYENAVAAAIMKAAENRRMQDLIQEVNIPMETVTEITDGGEKTVERKVFPGYVLCKMVLTGVERHEIVTGYQVGDTVKVTDGPLAGFLGTVEELEPDKDRVRVVVSMFGRETPVDLELDQVEEIKE